MGRSQRDAHRRRQAPTHLKLLAEQLELGTQLPHSATLCAPKMDATTQKRALSGVRAAWGLVQAESCTAANLNSPPTQDIPTHGQPRPQSSLPCTRSANPSLDWVQIEPELARALLRCC